MPGSETLMLTYCVTGQTGPVDQQGAIEKQTWVCCTRAAGDAPTLSGASPLDHAGEV
jgi:hypothetical protein